MNERRCRTPGGEGAAVRLSKVRVEHAGRQLLWVDQLVVEPGERVAVVGPNGAGKSTLLRVLAGLVHPSAGEVRVLGQATTALARREVGLLMQGLHLVPRLSARENVIVGALARLQGRDALRSWLRLYPAALVSEADAALAALGLSGRCGVRTDRLSGGERQKVALARLQLQRPQLVLADEPTAALDPSATHQACDALMALAQPAHGTLVSVLHDPELLPRLATRVIGIADGQVQWDLPVQALEPGRLLALYRRPALTPPAGAPASPVEIPMNARITHPQSRAVVQPRAGKPA